MANKFTKEALQSLKSVGSVAPSSKFLAKTMLKHIDFSSPLVIVEFGPGTGALTKPLLSELSESSLLYSFELNETFANQLDQQFADESQLKLIIDSALQFDEYLLADGIDKVDYFVSSLPLTLMNTQSRNILLDKCSDYLADDGYFLQYQYSLNSYKRLKEKFATVNVDFTLINLPPAFVYVCSNLL